MNKTLLITGGNKGIGLATTEQFIANDWRVIVMARDFSDFSVSRPDYVTQLPFDLAETNKIPDILQCLKNVDVFVNNAGIANFQPMHELSSQHVERLLKVNLEAPLILAREVSTFMQERKRGRIINVTSVGAHTGTPDVWYGATKAAILAATKGLAKLLGPDGIQCNSVAPGPVETEMFRSLPEKFQEKGVALALGGKISRPEDIAESIYWLATNAPDTLNGACIDINSGSYMR